MKRVSSNVRNAFEAKMNETLAKCQRYYKMPLPTVELIFKQMGHSAGQALYNPLTGEATIHINPDYLENHYESMLNQTMPHEVSHIVASFVHRKNCGHGPLWKMVCTWAGIPATRCHQYSLEGVKVKQYNKPFQYACKCRKWQFTARKHKTLQTPGRWSECRACGARLVYEGILINNILRPVVKPAEPLPVKVIVTFQEPKIEAPKPAEPVFKLVTRFINGTLQNVKIPA